MMSSTTSAMNKTQINELTKLEKRKFCTKEARNQFNRGLRNAGYAYE